MKKVLFVATVVKTHIMEFHIPYLKMFSESIDTKLCDTMASEMLSLDR